MSVFQTVFLLLGCRIRVDYLQLRMAEEVEKTWSQKNVLTADNPSPYLFSHPHYIGLDKSQHCVFLLWLHPPAQPYLLCFQVRSHSLSKEILRVQSTVLSSLQFIWHNLNNLHFHFCTSKIGGINMKGNIKINIQADFKHKI